MVFLSPPTSLNLFYNHNPLTSTAQCAEVFLSKTQTTLSKYTKYCEMKLIWGNRNEMANLVPRAFSLAWGRGGGKALASAGRVPTLHPEILGVIN